MAETQPLPSPLTTPLSTTHSGSNPKETVMSKRYLSLVRSRPWQEKAKPCKGQLPVSHLEQAEETPSHTACPLSRH